MLTPELLNTNDVNALSINDELVFHWSWWLFNSLTPSYTQRWNYEKIKYEGISLHVSSKLWVALSYANNRCYLDPDMRNEYWIGVSLYEDDKVITVFWPKDIDDALDVLFARTTYLYVLPRVSFFHKTEKQWYEWLWDLEMISLDAQSPESIWSINWKAHILELFNVLWYQILFEKN